MVTHPFEHVVSLAQMPPALPVILSGMLVDSAVPFIINNSSCQVPCSVCSHPLMGFLSKVLVNV